MENRAGGPAAARQRLLSVQKSNSGAPPYSRWFNRPAGRWFASWAYVMGLTPNQVTAISAVFTAAGLVLIAVVEPALWLGPAVAVLLLVGYALDSADGQLARLIGGGSPAGEWLDHMVDAVKVAFFHLVILVSFYRFGDGSEAVLLVALGFQVVYGVLFFGLIFMDVLRRTTVQSVPSARSSGGGRLQTILAMPHDYGVICLSLLFLGLPALFVPLYVLLFAANTVILSVVLRRWWREVKSWDPANVKAAQP